ncbi:MAG: cupin domain-containing protein [Chloroflexi bacterium]|nr:cupin domain-containing protein [Chloroflexota bacterium]
MAERVIEKGREPEPRETLYDQMRRIDNERIQRRREGRVVIRGKDIPYEQNRQGLVKWYSWDRNWDELSVTGWRIFTNLIKKHGGKHRHQGGLGIFVLSGKGYTVVDGVRYDWEDGDLIILPVKPDGCEHQHFSEAPDRNSEWMAFIFTPVRDPTGVEFLQREEHPDWGATRRK